MKRPALAGAPRVADALALACVVLAAIAIAASTYLAYREIAALRWASIPHDRNDHYLAALRLAVDARHADVARLLFDLDRARQWPPLHALLAASALLAFGFDARNAVLPSLAAWAGTILLAFLVARRAARANGNLAGALAALLVATSPAHRAFATDVMLESLGAFLFLLAIDAALRAAEGGDPRWFRRLGLALTLLLLEKYNYWLMAVLGLGAAAVAREPDAARRRIAAALAPLGRGAWWRARLREPTAWIVAASLAFAAAVAARGRVEGVALGIPVAVRSPGEALYPAYLWLLARAVLQLRRDRWEAVHRLDPRLRALLLWHGIPLALFLCLPARLGHLLAHVSPTNTQQPWAGPLHGVAFYAHAIATDDFAFPWIAAAAALLCAAACVAALRRQLDGGVLVVLGVAALLTVLHPNLQNRYAHNWIALADVGAGLGLAAIAAALRPPWLGRALGWTAVVAIAAACAPLAASVGWSQQAGHRDLGLSTRTITDAALAQLGPGRRVAFASNLDFGKVAEWSLLERFAARDRFAGAFPAHDTDDEAAFSRLLDGADQLVAIEFAPDSPFAWMRPTEASLDARIEGRGGFALASRRVLERERATVSVWVAGRPTGEADAQQAAGERSATAR